MLKGRKFDGTLNYLKEAEEAYTKSKWKQSCFNSRLTLEEFLREFREKVLKTSIHFGTATDHISVLKTKLKLSLGEQLLLKGFYGFLSNKGGHATTDRPTQEDAKMALYINYVCFEYFLEKFGKTL
jgi:hypothetical protein